MEPVDLQPRSGPGTHGANLNEILGDLATTEVMGSQWPDYSAGKASTGLTDAARRAGRKVAAIDASPRSFLTVKRRPFEEEYCKKRSCMAADREKGCGVTSSYLTNSADANLPVMNSTATANNIQARRPNQAFSQVIDIRSDSHGSYNGLDLTFRHQSLKGLRATSAFTWSKCIDEFTQEGSSTQVNVAKVRSL